MIRHANRRRRRRDRRERPLRQRLRPGTAHAGPGGPVAAGRGGSADLRPGRQPREEHSRRHPPAAGATRLAGAGPLPGSRTAVNRHPAGPAPSWWTATPIRRTATACRPRRCPPMSAAWAPTGRAPARVREAASASTSSPSAMHGRRPGPGRRAARRQPGRVRPRTLLLGGPGPAGRGIRRRAGTGPARATDAVGRPRRRRRPGALVGCGRGAGRHPGRALRRAGHHDVVPAGTDR